MTAHLPDSGDRSNFDTGAVRDASVGKGVPSNISPKALRRIAKRFEDGAAKYSQFNCYKGIPINRYIDSLYRHLWSYIEGDTSEDHLGAIGWNAVMLIDTAERIDEGTLPAELDDRLCRFLTNLAQTDEKESV